MVRFHYDHFVMGVKVQLIRKENLSNNTIPEEAIEDLSDLINSDVKEDTFQHNLALICDDADDIFMFNILNCFSLWGPQEAIKKMLKNKNVVEKSSRKFDGLTNAIILMTSSTTIVLKDVTKILDAKKLQLPTSQITCLKELFNNFHGQAFNEDFKYSVLLLLHIQSPRSVGTYNL